MSSTDEAALRRFFESQLVPAAKELRDRGVRFFPLGPEPEAETWYEPPPDAEPEFVEIEPEAFAAELRARWAGEGLPELAALAEPLMALAREVEVGEDESAEISPFVYVMY
jgi:hypothetical protein